MCGLVNLALCGPDIIMTDERIRAWRALSIALFVRNRGEQGMIVWPGQGHERYFSEQTIDESFQR